MDPPDEVRVALRVLSATHYGGEERGQPRCFGPVCRSIGLPQKSLWKISRRLDYIAFFELFVITCSLHGTRAVAGKILQALKLKHFEKGYNWSSQRRSEPPRASRWCVYPRRSLAGHLRSPGIAARRARSSAPRHERADPRTRAKTRGQRARPARANRKRPSCHGPCS